MNIPDNSALQASYEVFSGDLMITELRSKSNERVGGLLNFFGFEVVMTANQHLFYVACIINQGVVLPYRQLTNELFSSFDNPHTLDVHRSKVKRGIANAIAQQNAYCVAANGRRTDPEIVNSVRGAGWLLPYDEDFAGRYTIVRDGN